jgi:AcrR family transcriptional regulator
LRGKYDRTKTPDERHTEQKTKLLDAARDVLAARGWAGSTVDAVLKESQLSRATFYLHYRELDELLLDAYQRAVQTGYRHIQEQMAETAIGADRVRAGVTSYLALVAQYPKLAKILLDVGPGAPSAVLTLRQAQVERGVTMIMSRLTEAHVAGLLPNPVDELTVLAIFGAMETVARRYLDRGEPEKAMEAAPALMRLFLRAVT